MNYEKDSSDQSNSDSPSDSDVETEDSDDIQDDKTVDEGLSLIDEFITNDDDYSSFTNSELGEEAEEGGGDVDKKESKILHRAKGCHYLRKHGPEIHENKEAKKQVAKNKKKKKRRLAICTVNCKYEVVRRIAARFEMKEVSEDEQWNLYWTDLSVSVERAKEMKRFQKINHFPGMIEICRKDLLARNLTRMFKMFPRDYNFFPKTWCLPADFGDALSYARTRRNRTYICKPETGCQGRGIFLTKSMKDIKPFDRMICQVYLNKPFLIDGYKFDLRVYVLITSCDPLRIFVYNDGLVRFATSKYREPTHTNTSNVFMHLTNYSVNKHSRTYVVDDEAGSKRKISTLTKFFEKKDYNVKDIWSRIDDVIIKTIIAAHPILKHSYHTCFPCHDSIYACFELLGFDILLDHRLKPYILEVNHSPSFHTDAQIDRDIKESLLTDTFQILNLAQADKWKVIEEDRKRIQDRLLQGIHKDSQDTSHTQTSEQLLFEAHRTQMSWEEKHKGNYRCIYPALGSEKYDCYFNQNQSSLYQDTAASRAREECARIQRVELESKLRLEAAKRFGGKMKEHERINFEGPISKDTKLKTIPLRKLPMPIKKSVMEIKGRTVSSFEPDPIVDTEERERITGMAQRDFLIRSYGVLEQIYLIFQKNGTLKPDDEKKYGVYGKLGCIQEVHPVISANKLPSMLPTQASKYSYIAKATRNFCVGAQLNDNNTREKMEGVFETFLPTQSQTGLTIVCNNAPIFTRPHIPRATWVDESNKDRDFRITKTHVARAFSNSVKLQELEKREHRHLNSEN